MKTLPNPWRQALPALVLLWLWTLVLYRDTSLGMVQIWARSDTFTHGFLVLPIVLWLVWRARQTLALQTPYSSVSPLVLVAGVAALWLLADWVSVNAVTQIAVVALLVLTVPTVLGWAVARVIIFPLFFLFFAVPMGEFLLPQFMAWTADFTIMALRLSGIPGYREGLQFVIPSGNWSVVEACSGIRYLIASLTVGTLFAYLNFQSRTRRALFVLASVLVPIAANWVRAYLIVMLGHLSGNKLAAGVDHLIYGWLFFGLVMLLMFYLGARWAEPAPVTTTTPNVDASVPRSALTATRLWTLTASCAVLVAVPQVVQWQFSQQTTGLALHLVAPPVLTADWLSTPPGDFNFKPSFQHPAAEINQHYTRQGAPVGLYVGYYTHQNYQSKLVSSSNVLVGSHDDLWAQLNRSSRPLTLAAQSLAVQRAELRGGASHGSTTAPRLLVWQLYWINGTLTSNDYLAKVYGAFDRLLGRGDDAAVIVIYTPQALTGEVASDALLASFLSTNYAAIHKLLLTTRQGRS